MEGIQLLAFVLNENHLVSILEYLLIKLASKGIEDGSYDTQYNTDVNSAPKCNKYTFGVERGKGRERERKKCQIISTG